MKTTHSNLSNSTNPEILGKKRTPNDSLHADASKSTSQNRLSISNNAVAADHKPSRTEPPWSIIPATNKTIPSPSSVIHRPELIKLNPKWTENFNVNESITFSLPHSDFTAVLEKKSHFNNGSVSWTGHLVGLDKPYPVTFTIGKNTGFGTINTPEGEYSIEIKGDTGTVYKTPRVDQISTEGHPDFLIPDVENNFPSHDSTK